MTTTTIDKRVELADESTRFDGVLSYVDTPSDAAPSGARGHRVILTRLAAEEALDSLWGKPLKCGAFLEEHYMALDIGLITQADVVNGELRIAGVIPPAFYRIANILHTYEDELGISYELDDAFVSDIKKEIWVLNRVTFTGAAIILKRKAAYKRTSIRLRQA